VFGRGYEFGGPSGGVIVVTDGSTSVTGAAIIAERKKNARSNYSQGTTTDLVVKPSNGAVWHNNGSASGIKYGANGFFAVDGVTVHPYKLIFGTKYEAKFWNWVLFFVCFGFIWMWF